MNIFVLSRRLRKCAQYHCDQHIVKMILESAQMLCTVCILSGGTAPYRIAHSKHPCTLWALSSLSNWRWLKSLAEELNREFQYRYDKKVNHKSWDVITSLEEPDIEDKGLTPFAQAMPEQYRRDDAVLAYRLYYVNEKSRFATWKKRDIPEWYIKMKEDSTEVLSGDEDTTDNQDEEKQQEVVEKVVKKVEDKKLGVETRKMRRLREETETLKRKPENAKSQARRRRK